jgi:diguanylate cyclase
MAHDDAPTSLRGARRAALALALGGAGLLVYALHALTGLGAGHASLFDHWLYDGVEALAAALCLARGLRGGSAARPWLFLGLGLVAWTSGDVYWNRELADLASPPYPSWSDAGWLLFYPFSYVAVVLLLRSRVERLPSSAWLDGLIGALSVAALTAAAVLEPVLHATHGAPATVVTNLAYPIGDLLLLAFVVLGSALQGWRMPRSWIAIGAGLAVSALVDTIYLVETAHGTYHEGGLLDAGWPLAALLLAAAAWSPEPARAGTATLRGWRQHAMTGAFSLAVAAVLVLDTVRRLSVGAHVLLMLAIAAIVIRLAAAALENRRLQRSRMEALTDELTGLGNRRRFYALADEAIGAAVAAGRPLAVLLVDLDRFKELNDTLGHSAGDDLLRQVAQRLDDALPEAIVVARLGGDEFIALLPAGTNPASAALAGERLNEALTTPFPLEGLHAQVHASIGIAAAPEHGTDRGALMRHADVAMYRAKRLGTGIELYSADHDRAGRDRIELSGQLRAALDLGQIVVHFQPQVDLATGEPTGAEALVRWGHPERGLLTPDRFLPLAEQAGLMRRLTLHVLDRALLAQAAWRAERHELAVSVNLSVTNLLDVRFPDEARQVLSRHDADAAQVTFEVTEDKLMVDPARAADVLEQLSAMGFPISLDDFGTGYSSLTHLRLLPVSELKIDRSFVQGMESSAEDAAIVRALVELGRHVQVRVVAEGVETAHAWTRLASLGCDTAQGYLLSRPMAPGDLLTWLEERHAGGEARAAG